MKFDLYWDVLPLGASGLVEIGIDPTLAENLAKKARELDSLPGTLAEELRTMGIDGEDFKDIEKAHKKMIQLQDEQLKEFEELVETAVTDKETEWRWAKLQARQHELHTFRGPYAKVMKFTDLQKRIIKKYVAVQIKQVNHRTEVAAKRRDQGLKPDYDYGKKAATKRVFDMFYELGESYDDCQWRTYLRLLNFIEPGAPLISAVKAMKPPQQGYYLRFPRMRELWIEAGYDASELPELTAEQSRRRASAK